MSEINNRTLLICLQSVYQSIKRFEGLLESETMRKPADIQESLHDYDRALEILKDLYEEELSKGADLPPIEEIIQDRESKEAIPFKKKS
ncbi:MAG: hypothetical protein HY308_04915 [Gammaproteobacteria bacterium]|nr:hypothetical protein [Gammaproteobacteria bacterium]